MVVTVRMSLCVLKQLSFKALSKLGKPDGYALAF